MYRVFLNSVVQVKGIRRSGIRSIVKTGLFAHEEKEPTKLFITKNLGWNCEILRSCLRKKNSQISCLFKSKYLILSLSLLFYNK